MYPSWWWLWVRVGVTETRFVKMNIRVRDRNATTQVDRVAHGGEQLERELHGDSISPVLGTGNNRQQLQQQINLGTSAD